MEEMNSLPTGPQDPVVPQAAPQSAPQAAPQPAPQPQYRAPQPQYTAPQPQYTAPQPQPAPQPQYTAPQPQPAPQPQYAAQPQPQPAPQPAKEKKSSGKKILPIAIAAVAVVALLAAAFFLLNGKSGSLFRLGGSKDDVTTAINKTLDAIEQNELVAYADKLTSGGSIAVTQDIAKLEDSLGMKLEATADATLFMDKDDAKFALTLGGKYQKKDLLEAKFYLDLNNAIVAECEEILGKDALGIGLKDLPKRLEKSVFGPDGDYALPEEFYELLDQKDLTGDLESLGKDAKKILDKAYGEIVKIITKNAKIEKTSGTLTFGEKEIKENIISVELDDKAQYDIVTAILEWVKSDKDLKKFLTNLPKEYADLFEAIDMDPDDFEDVKDDFYESVEDLLEDLKEFDKDDIEDEFPGTYTAKFYINKSNGQLNALDLTVKGEGGKTNIVLQFGPDVTKLCDASLTLKDSDNNKTSYSLTVENTKKNCDIKVKVKEGTSSDTLCSFTWDKKEGSFKLSSEDTLTVTGTMTQKGSKTTIEVKKVELDYYASYYSHTQFSTKNMGMTIVLDTNAKMPSAPSFDDIIELKDEDAVEELIEKISENFEKFQDDLIDKIDD